MTTATNTTASQIIVLLYQGASDYITYHCKAAYSTIFEGCGHLDPTMQVKYHHNETLYTIKIKVL